MPNGVKPFLTPLVGRIPVTITGGRNKGMKWSLASAGNGYRTGSREPQRISWLHSLILPGDVVWDVGAHYGSITLMASRRVGERGGVHAFEPARQSRWLLSRHVAWNHLANVTVHPYALSNVDGKLGFGGSGSSQLFALGGGPELVEVKRGTTLVKSGVCPPPTFVKIDTEGAEGAVVEGMLDVIAPTTRLFIAMHSLELFEKCTTLLAPHGFVAMSSPELERADPRNWPGDPDALFFNPEHGEHKWPHT